MEFNDIYILCVQKNRSLKRMIREENKVGSCTEDDEGENAGQILEKRTRKLRAPASKRSIQNGD
jgi:hypothetical protein